MRLRIVDISAAIAAACALAVPILIGGSPVAAIQSLVAPNGTGVDVVRARAVAVVSPERGRSSRAAPSRRPPPVRREAQAPEQPASRPRPRPAPEQPRPDVSEPTRPAPRPQPSNPSPPPVAPPPPAPPPVAPPPPAPPPPVAPPPAPPPPPAAPPPTPPPPIVIASPSPPPTPIVPPSPPSKPTGPPRTPQGHDDDDDSGEDPGGDEGEDDEGPCESQHWWCELDRAEQLQLLSKFLTQLAVEIERRGYQGEVGKRLREIAEELSGRSDLFGVEAEMVPVGQHLLENQPRFVYPSGSG
jgi:hypothetical protein